MRPYYTRDRRRHRGDPKLPGARHFVPHSPMTRHFREPAQTRLRTATHDRRPDHPESSSDPAASPSLSAVGHLRSHNPAFASSSRRAALRGYLARSSSATSRTASLPPGRSSRYASSFVLRHFGGHFGDVAFSVRKRQRVQARRNLGHLMLRPRSVRSVCLRRSVRGRGCGYVSATSRVAMRVVSAGVWETSSMPAFSRAA